MSKVTDLNEYRAKKAERKPSAAVAKPPKLPRVKISRMGMALVLSGLAGVLVGSSLLSPWKKRRW